MILTVTLNPSVDIGYSLDKLAVDDVNRATNVSKTPGGKGLNVSRVLKQLNHHVGATGFLGGELGDFIRHQLPILNIEDKFVSIEGATRNCIAILHEDGKQTEVLEGGPEISSVEAKHFLTSFEKAVESTDIVTMSGSLPKGLQVDFYHQLITLAVDKNVPVLLDTSGSALESAISGIEKPFLIKPNESELAKLLKKDLNGEADFVQALRDPIFDGIEWVVATLGGDGAIVKNGEDLFTAKIPKVEVINPVGSGDSVIAGFAAGLKKGLNHEDLIKYGLSMGVLNAMESQTGRINPDKVDWCIEQIKVEKV